MPAHPGPGREEIDQPQGVFMDTPLKIAVDKASRLLDGFAEEDEEKKGRLNWSISGWLRLRERFSRSCGREAQPCASLPVQLIGASGRMLSPGRLTEQNRRL